METKTQVDESEYLTVNEVAKMLGKSTATIIRWCQRKKLETVSVSSPGPGGYAYRISRESVLRFVSIPQIHEQADHVADRDLVNQSVREKKLERQDDGDYIPSIEAERLIKLEKYRKEKRNNDLAEDSLVSISKYISILDGIFSEIWVREREFLDKWIVKLNLDPQIAKSIREDYEGNLREFLFSQKRKAETVHES